jgi:hypothetical protein
MTPIPTLNLRVLDGLFTVHRFAADHEVPAAVQTSAFYTISHTAEELSIVCDAALALASEKAETGWSCIKVAGPLDFGLTGVLAAAAVPLAAAGISIFAVSTFDTDYILVKADRLKQAREVLAAAGHIFGEQ